jgi:hypothetical protein
MSNKFDNFDSQELHVLINALRSVKIEGYEEIINVLNKEIDNKEREYIVKLLSK